MLAGEILPHANFISIDAGLRSGGLNDERERLPEVPTAFWLPSIYLVEKDLKVVCAVACFGALDVSRDHSPSSSSILRLQAHG